jgi:hypothetical protein
MDRVHRVAPHALSALIAASLAACIATLLSWGSASSAAEARSVVGAESTGAVVLAMAMVVLAVGAWMHWSDLHWVQPATATVLASVIVVVSVAEVRSGYAAQQASRLLDGAAVTTAPGGGVWLSLAAGVAMTLSALMLVAATRAESVVHEYSGLVLMPGSAAPAPLDLRDPHHHQKFDGAADPVRPSVSGQSAVHAAGLNLAPMASYALAAAPQSGSTLLEDPHRTTVIEPPDAALVVRDAAGVEHRHVLGGHTSIGRGATNDLVIDDGFASSDHAEIRRVPLGWELHDTGSTNGTRRNGAPVTAPARLEQGDQIEIGKTLITFA